jgi:hypothetical protein
MEDVSRKRVQQPSQWGNITTEFDASRAVLYHSLLTKWGDSTIMGKNHRS